MTKRRVRRPVEVYVVLRATAALAATIAFSIAPLYRIRTVGMTPFELVLAGTVMEAAVFAFEIPTGIVADAVSRRWSVIVGHAGMGAALVFEALVPTVAGVLAAQAAWGIAYTFTSGATEAWLSGELSRETQLSGELSRETPVAAEPGSEETQLSSLFLRASRWSSVAALVGIPAAFGLAAFGLRVPLVIGGGLSLALAGWLVKAMHETGYEPTTRGGRSTWQHLAGSTRAGLGEIRTQRALVWLAAMLLVAGGASEAYDRLTERHFVADIGFPRTLGGSSLTWLAIMFMASAATGIAVPALVARAAPAADRRRLGRWMVGLYVGQVVALAVFGLAAGFVVAAVAVVLVDRTRSVRESLTAAWVIPLTSPGRRATVLSTIGQFDAAGQVLIGPTFGLIASRAGVGPSLVVSAAVMAPGALLLARAGRSVRELSGA